MNYRSQLRAWAVDRAIEAHKANNMRKDSTEKGLTTEDIITAADALVDYAYVSDEDWTDVRNRIFDLAQTADLLKLEELRDTLDIILEQRGAERETKQ